MLGVYNVVWGWSTVSVSRVGDLVAGGSRQVEMGVLGFPVKYT